jgi:hypothetical protein
MKQIAGKCFDGNGRFIPQESKMAVQDANPDFRLEQPTMTEEAEFANRIQRLHRNLGIDTGFTAKQFQRQSNELCQALCSNQPVADSLNGVWLPVVLPPLGTDDLGTELEQCLEAVSKSYVETFSGRRFRNYCENRLANKVGIIKSSRADQLIDKMRQGPVPAIHFPNPLQGLSVSANWKCMAALPEGFVLSGLDTAIAMVMYPDILAPGCQTPGLYLSALSRRYANGPLYFRADDDQLDFGHVGSLALGNGSGSGSGGLLFIGPN